jgi:hypothetical protein
VGTLDDDVREDRFFREWVDLEGESGSESDMATEGVGQEVVVGQEGVRGEEETANSNSEEALGAFEDGGAGASAFGRATANKQASDVAFDEVLIEIGK